VRDPSVSRVASLVPPLDEVQSPRPDDTITTDSHRRSSRPPGGWVSYARRGHEAMSERRHYSEQEFEALVSSALDELPIEFQRALEHVAIVVSDRGAENHAYGMYVGSKLRGNPFFGGGGLPDEILIFRDTLVRDFGDDPNRLRIHVIQTVRHEVGHHLGFNEAGVHKLGL
jgi:predicted Zn-dependent protease with MMP-like domain